MTDNINRSARRGDWKTKPMPRKHETFVLQRSFTEEEMNALRRGNVPQAMEDKWFWFMEGQTLWAHRSWTGHCIYRIDFKEDGSHVVTVNRDPGQYGCTSTEEDTEILNKLLDWWTQTPYDHYNEWLSETCDAIEKSRKTETVSRFAGLVEKENGFEFYQAFRDELDWIIGGKDNVFWFSVMQDQSVKETYVGVFKDGAWSDCMIKGKGKRRSTKEMPAGSTIKRIEERAYFMQDADWVTGRKPRLIEDAHPHYHYTYGIGDKALDVSEAYGVSIGYSDLKDPSAGFRLRYLYTGKDVDASDVADSLKGE